MFVVVTTLYREQRGMPYGTAYLAFFASTAVLGIRRATGPRAERHGLSPKQSVGYVAAFATLLLGVGLAFGLRPHFRPVDIREVPARAQPLIDAILAYERANGEPPASLEVLVPEHLDAVPKTGLGLSQGFDYRRIRDRSLPPYVWYAAGDRRGRTPETCTFPDGDVDQALLVLFVDAEDNVTGAAADRVPVGVPDEPFAADVWRGDPLARPAMVRSAATRYRSAGLTVGEVAEELGPPDGRGHLLPRRWELQASELLLRDQEIWALRYVPTGQYRACSEWSDVEAVGEWQLGRDRMGGSRE